MPAPELFGRYQLATLYMAQEAYDRYGQRILDTPVQVYVQLQTKRQQVVTADGETVALDATAIADRRITVGSLLVLGAGLGTGTDDELMEVKTYNETPDAKNRYKAMSVGLMRFRQALPVAGDG